MKPGNLNFLEPSGPIQACNGTALPYLYHSVNMYYNWLQEQFCNLSLYTLIIRGPGVA
jgi:secreted trypsin-like serine protease